MVVFAIDATRYRKIKRDDVLNILEAAELKPDQFIAHRNNTFTAKFLKAKLPSLTKNRYETRLEEQSEHDLAIFKRPTRLDRGKYVTLNFGFVAMERLGIDLDASTNGHSNGKHKPAFAAEGDLATTVRMIGIVRDMKQLTQYTRDIVENDSNRAPALVALAELEKQVNRMADGLHRMIRTNGMSV